jgi:formate/nitrite transporter FocA (FNT family)
MKCPRCFNTVDTFATRCPNCTTEFGMVQNWLINLVGNLLGLAIVILVVYWIFF